MKLATTLILALTTLATANPGPAAAIVKRAADCNNCKSRYDFCFDNGRTEGQEGCAVTCAQHVCYQTPDCRGCGGVFRECPEVSRYHKACGKDRC